LTLTHPRGSDAGPLENRSNHRLKRPLLLGRHCAQPFANPAGELARKGRRQIETARLAFGRVQVWEPLRESLNDDERRKRQLAEIRKAIDANESGPPLVLVTHGSVVSNLVRLNLGMGAFVVLRGRAEGAHAMAGRLYIDD
jgi:hypothetical protein